MESQTIHTHGGSHAEHYQAAGFSEEVSWLVAAPRRPSTNGMYSDRWLCFAHSAAEQGIDPLGPTAAKIAIFLNSLFDTHGLSLQTIKGYRTCLASVLNHTGKTTLVQLFCYMHTLLPNIRCVCEHRTCLSGKRKNQRLAQKIH